MSSLTDWFRKEKNRRLVFYLTAALLLLYVLKPDLVIPVTTQSVLSVAGISLTISVLVMLVGIVLVIIPEPATTMLGIVMIAVSLFVGGWSFIVALNSIISAFPLGTYGIYALVAYTGYILYKRYVLKRK